MIYVFQEDMRNGLGMLDNFKIFLIYRDDWIPSYRWNWNETARYKRTSGILITDKLYNMLITTADARSMFAIHFQKINKTYWIKMTDLESWRIKKGTSFIDEYSGKSVTGFPKEIFEELSEPIVC